MHNLKNAILFIVLFCALSFSATDKPPPPTLSAEQIQLQNEVIEQFNKNNKHYLSKDSVQTLLGFKNALIDSCLDQNCNVTKIEFNNYLNTYDFYSVDNCDSIRTNILFSILTDKYIKMQSENMQQNLELLKGNFKGDSVLFNSYKLRLITSTDSIFLVNSLKNITNRKWLFTKPVEIIFHNYKGENGKIIDIFFDLEKKYLDFNIQKSTIDSATENIWTEPKRSNCGFYSFNVTDKFNYHSEYDDLVATIENERVNSHINVDTLNDISNFVLNNTDTLDVKLWVKAAALSDSGKIVGIDTNTLSFMYLPDCQLPENIRAFVREQYIQKGTLFFENIKNSYCLWSLRIEKHKKDNVKCSNEVSQNYLLAKNVLLRFQEKKDIIRIKEKAGRQQQYVVNLFKHNRTQFLSEPDEYKAAKQTAEITELQLHRSVFNWIQEQIVFNKNIFFIKYLTNCTID